MEQTAYDYATFMIESDETVFYIEVHTEKSGPVNSEFFLSLSDAYKAFDDCKASIKYFGGGTIELIAKYRNIYTTVCVAII